MRVNDLGRGQFLPLHSWTSTIIESLRNLTVLPRVDTLCMIHKRYSEKAMAELKKEFPEVRGASTLRLRSDGTTRGAIAVRTDPKVTHPQLLVRGTQEQIDAIRFDPRSNGLDVTTPDTGGGGVSSTSGRHNVMVTGDGVIAGDVSGGVHIGGVGGRIVVNGVDVTQSVQGNSKSSEPLTVSAIVPPGSSVDVEVPGSSVRLDGDYNQVLASSNNESITHSGYMEMGRITSKNSDLRVGDVGRHITASTHNGHVEIGAVVGDGKVKSHNGDVTVTHADPSGDLNLSSYNGDVGYGIRNTEALNRVHASAHNGNTRPFQSTRTGPVQPEQARQRGQGEQVRDSRGQSLQQGYGARGAQGYQRG